MNDIESNIKKYIEQLAPGILPVKDFSNIVIKKIGGGDYNLNSKIGIGNRHFLMRLNVESQSGLKNQIEYEYKTLQFLRPYKITPIPYFLDNTKKFFPYGLLIEEYIKGEKLIFSIESIKRVARTLAKLHSIPLSSDSDFFMHWENPLRQQFDSASDSLTKYRKRKTANKKLVLAGDRLLKKIETTLSSLESNFKPKSIVHTDLVPSNFIDMGNKAYLIDWEKARIDDPSYDIAVFCSKISNLWDSPAVLTADEKKTFIESYISETGDSTIEDRMSQRLTLFNLHAVLWAAGRISDVEEGVISGELGKHNYARYKKLINLEELNNF